MQASESTAAIYVDGSLEEVMRVPGDCVPSLKAYLEKQGHSFPMGLLIRIFVANWRSGVDLSEQALDRIGMIDRSFDVCFDV